MSVFEGVGDVRDHANRFLLGEGASGESLPEGSALNKLRDDEAGVVVQSDIEYGNDALVFESCDPSCFSLKCLLRFDLTCLRHLDGDRPMEFRVEGTKHFGESTLGDEFVEPITPRERSWGMRRIVRQVVGRVVFERIVDP